MNLKYKIVINTLIQFIGRLGTSGLGFLTTIILAGFLGASGYGSYSKIFALVSFFFLWVDFGLNAVFIRKFQNNLKNFSMLNAARTLFFILSLFAIILFLIFTRNLVFSSSEKKYVLLFAPVILMFAYQTSLNLIFQLKLRYEIPVAASIIGSSIGLLLLWFLKDQGLFFIIISLLCGYLATVIISAGFAKKITSFSFFHEPFNLSDLYVLIRNSLPLGITLFLNSLYVRADVFVISAYHGNSAVGVYQLAYKFFEFPLSLATFFANSIFPHYVELYTNDRAKFWDVFYKVNLILLLIATSFSTLGFFLAPFLTFINSDYQSSVLPLRILVLSYPVFFITSSLNWLIFLKKQEKHLVWVYGISFIINVLANLAFVPTYGYLASSIITVIGEIIVLIFLLLVCNIKPKPELSNVSLRE